MAFELLHLIWGIILYCIIIIMIIILKFYGSSFWMENDVVKCHNKLQDHLKVMKGQLGHKSDEMS